MPQPRKPNQVAVLRTRSFTLLVTNTTKLAGVFVGINELAVRSNTTTARMALAALMMTGAQVTEGALISILDRMLGKTPVQPEET